MKMHSVEKKHTDCF